MKSIFLSLLVVVCLASPMSAQDVPRFELGAGATFLRDPGNLNRYGWIGSFGTNINRFFAVKAEASGFYNGFESDNIHSVLLGPQVNLRRDGSRVTPWAHFLVGAQTGHEFRFPGRFVSETYWAMQPGGGVDVSLNSRVGLRFGADYVRSFRDLLRDFDHYRLHAGFVFKLP
jgi:hypothetical protein